MAYVLKNTQGEVIAASADKNPGATWTFIENDAKEYLEYLEKALAKSSVFRESDIQMARVLEDLIDLLVERNIIHFTDLPEAAQHRLNQRQTMRRKTQLSGLLDDTSHAV